VYARDLPRCRWFKRGWTLQELLAPKHVQFFDGAWAYIGNKETLGGIISTITGIPREYLIEEPLASASVAIKMSWAARRETKRTEDRAYSLLGIFDVSMPLIYGEGMKAFRRLQEEIIKQHNDLTIFAWETDSSTSDQLVGPLALSPDQFAASQGINRHDDAFTEFSITNRGVLLSNEIPFGSATLGKHKVYLLGSGIRNTIVVHIYLVKIGPSLFCRMRSPRRMDTRHPDWSPLKFSQIYLMFNTRAASKAAKEYRSGAIHVLLDSTFRCSWISPQTLWDETDRVFLRPQTYDSVSSPVLVMGFDVTLHQKKVSLAVLWHHSVCGSDRLHPIIFSQDQYPHEYEVVTQARYQQAGIDVQEMHLHARSTRDMTQSTVVKTGNVLHQISVSLQLQSVQTSFGERLVCTLCLSVDGGNS
jgi:hypothetical protein